MQKYISFLRSVNMAGHNLMKMTELTDLYIGLGFADAQTYIQSGNVIFTSDSDKPASVMSEKIEIKILERFGFPISVITRTKEEVAEFLKVNPFLSEPDYNPAKNAVILLHEKPSEQQMRKVSDVDYPPDKFKVLGSEIYTYCPNGFGKTKLYTNFFEKKMSVIGTARNWKTITTLLDLSGI